MEFDTMCEPDDIDEKINTAQQLIKNVQETGIVPPKLFDQSLRPKDVNNTETTPAQSQILDPATAGPQGAKDPHQMRKTM